MPLINLIQEQRLIARKLEQKGRMAFLTFVGSAVATVGVYGLLSLQAEMLHSEAARLTTETRKLDPVVNEIAASDKEAAALQPRLQTLTEAQSASDRWARILTHLTTQTPPDTWLTGLRGSALQADKPVNLVLTGTSTGQDPIGEFILRVENQPDLENVALHFTQEKVTFGAKQIDFEVAADLSGTAEQKAVVKQDQGEAKS